jgi:Zn-dependent protease with chaperone function
MATTGLAVLVMGPRGQMVHGWDGWLTYGFAGGWIATGTVLAIVVFWQAQQTMQRLHTYPTIDLAGQPSHLIQHHLPFIAQIGLWQPRLLVSQGLLNTLSSEHLAAVLVHEQAHSHYHDTFWFFVLGWLRRVTSWLPQSEALWQELLLLRELRADRWAAQVVDPLLLAEALVIVVRAPLETPDLAAAFGDDWRSQRLAERIEALIASEPAVAPPTTLPWGWLLLALVPLLVIPFHT